MRPSGDSALIVQIGGNALASDAVLDEALLVQTRLQHAAIPGVTEITSAFGTVAVFYNPLRVAPREETIFASLEAAILEALRDRADTASGEKSAPARAVEIPVCYATEFALDLEDVARHSEISPEEVISLHSSADYRVACVGFTAGFPYLAGLPAQISTPRRASPRTAVPAGSVAIGGSQTGVYPSQAPGGWQIIGRTPLRLFDPAKPSPALLRAGDRVRFRSMTLQEFYESAADAPRAGVQAPANK